MLINSKYLEEKIIQEVINLINTMNVSDKDEADWIAATSLALCGFDHKINKLILTS